MFQTKVVKTLEAYFVLNNFFSKILPSAVYVLKIGTIQRWLTWPLRKDDTQNREAFHIFIFGEINGKLPLRTCPGYSVPEPCQSPDWALVQAQTGPRAEYSLLLSCLLWHFCGKKLYSGTSHRWLYDSCALHNGYLHLQTHILMM